MSDTETHRGKIIPVLRGEKENLAEYIERATGIEFLDANGDETDDIQEFIYENDLFEKFVWYDNKFYKIESEELDDDYPVNHKVMPDGSIEFSCRFYNGGTCLAEIIEEILEEQK